MHGLVQRPPRQEFSLNKSLNHINALKVDANTLLRDVLDVSTSTASSEISEKLAALPMEEQRKIMRILDVMINEENANQS